MSIILKRDQVVGAALAALTIISVTHAAPFKVVHSFRGGDGQRPFAGLASDGSGNFFGVTAGDTPNRGKHCSKSCGNGNAYALYRDSGFQPLYSFRGGNDGSHPFYPILPLKDVLYGTTRDGGLNGSGTLFRIANGREKILYNFCSQPDCADGSLPSSGLIADAKGNLYGETIEPNGGLVFKFSPQSGRLKVVYKFCQMDNCADGSTPFAGVFQDRDGSLYGTTASGGTGGITGQTPCPVGHCGTVFRIASDGSERVLYDFCSRKNCNDGWSPLSDLTKDASGNLYGTTIYGGRNKCDNTGDVGCGTIFKLAPDGSETVLYHFCDPNLACPNAPQPESGVIFDKAGNLYGTTITGGVAGHGTAYKLAPDGVLTVLHDFCPQSGCADGQDPYSDLLLQGKYLYGTTLNGGKDGVGVIFKVEK